MKLFFYVVVALSFVWWLTCALFATDIHKENNYMLWALLMGVTLARLEQHK